jgi:hypothetical protein
MNSRVFNDFMKIVAKDTAMREQLRLAGSANGIELEKLAQFAASKGYPFKVEEVTTELSDGQLDKVTGGLATSFGTLNTVYKFDNAFEVDASIYSSGGVFMFKL